MVSLLIFVIYSITKCLNCLLIHVKRLRIRNTPLFTYYKIQTQIQKPSCVSLPADAEAEIVSASFDQVQSLAVSQVLRPAAVNGKDDVAWTQVDLRRLAASCHLQITFNADHMQTKESKTKNREESAVTHGVVNNRCESKTRTGMSRAGPLEKNMQCIKMLRT